MIQKIHILLYNEDCTQKNYNKHDSKKHKEKQLFISFILSIFVVVIDQALKKWIVGHLPLHTSQEILPGIVEFYHLRNKGAGWGVLEGEMTFFYMVTLLAVAYLIYLVVHDKDQSRWTSISYGLLLGGAIGNFIDRVVHGYVVDMIRLTFINFPVFNIADIALTFGVVLLIIYLLVIQEEVDHV